VSSRIMVGVAVGRAIAAGVAALNAQPSIPTALRATKSRSLRDNRGGIMALADINERQ